MSEGIIRKRRNKLIFCRAVRSQYAEAIRQVSLHQAYLWAMSCVRQHDTAALSLL
jgi:hypothetical protein